MPNFSTSEKGRKLIEGWEGCILTAYKMPGEKLFTIGYGHTGAEVTEGMTITQAEASRIFAEDLKKYEKWTYTYASGKFATQNEFDALLSYCYNAGPGALQTAARNADKSSMLEKMMHTVRGGNGVVFKGLQRRRICEARLYFNAEYIGTPPATDYALFYKSDGSVIPGSVDIFRYNLALNKLEKALIINTPQYWKLHKNDVPFLDLLIINIADKLPDGARLVSTKQVTTELAISFLALKGIINTPEFWKTNVNKVDYLDLLMQRVAVVLGI